MLGTVQDVMDQNIDQADFLPIPDEKHVSNYVTYMLQQISARANQRCSSVHAEL